MYQLSYLIFFGFLKVGENLTCFEDDKVSKGGSLSTNHCETTISCFYNMTLSKAGCSSQDTKCSPTDGCWVCDWKPLCNNKEFIKKKEAENADLKRINNNENVTSTKTCYTCRENDCETNYTQLPTCSSSSDCYYGFRKGILFRGCQDVHCALMYESISTRCFSCNESMCNGDVFADYMDCYDCRGRECLSLDGDTVIPTCKTTKEAGCSLVVMSDTPRARCGNLCLKRTNAKECIACNKNLCNELSLKEATNYFIELTASQCYECDTETCNDNDVNMAKCVSYSCYLSLVNFVEKRGCGSYCKTMQPSANEGNYTIDYCFECRRSLCNSNQEKQMFVNEDFDTTAKTKATLTQRIRTTNSCRNVRTRIGNVVIAFATYTILLILNKDLIIFF